MNIPFELFSSFNDIIYLDEPHKYYLNDNELISVTTLIHRYQENFDEKYWSEYKANELSVKSSDIISGWNFINKKGTSKGSIIHDYAENIFLNKMFKYPKDQIINQFGFDPIVNEYNITKKHVDMFKKDMLGKLIPIRTEMVVYDKESLIAGMMDMLFYNVRYNTLQIYDWKTNKDFSMTSKNRLKGSLYLLHDCDYNIYSLQLSMYKRIIERNTGIKLGDMYVVWFSHKNTKYEIIKMKDMSYFVDIIINERIDELKKVA